MGHHAIGNADNVEEPEQVEGLQADEQGGGDDLAEETLVLPTFPVKQEGTNGAVLGEQRPDNLEVDEVAQIDPGAHEDDEEGGEDGRVEIIEGLGGGKEPVTDIVRDVHGDADVGEVEAVAQPNERQGGNMVTDQLLVVLAGLLHAEDENNGLLCPVGSLEEVVELELGIVGLVRIALVHAAGVEVPDWREAHDIHAKRAKEAEVDSRVDLLHETGHLVLAEASTATQWTDDLLHDELASKRQDDGVKGDKGNVPETLSVVFTPMLVVEGLGELVGEEDEAVDGVGRRGVDSVSEAEEGDDGQGEDEGVLDHGMADTGDEAEFSAARHALAILGGDYSCERWRSRRATGIDGFETQPAGSQSWGCVASTDVTA